MRIEYFYGCDEGDKYISKMAVLSNPHSLTGTDRSNLYFLDEYGELNAVYKDGVIADAIKMVGVEMKLSDNRMTNRELAAFLTKNIAEGNCVEVWDKNGDVITTGYSYFQKDEDRECPESVRVRVDFGEWFIPEKNI